ncbi:MAG: UDP-N-acetylmuramoyl-tripeptide--D-alanyl-D-alanine ligase [Bacteroidetes bacterium]|nr:UDP-N-acetylmuramoyl-tripeptide--D-alanyl-D-alanine ligase [Bacteroidota bacterium]
MNIQELYALFCASSGVTSDSRKINQNQLFFALRGENFNGNSFAQRALELGATYSIIDEPEYQTNEKCILVDDVLTTLQQLANYHLHQIRPKTILAITGSNGKTTTKELVHAVLSTTYNTHYTKGNYNNHIGIPLTLLEMPANTDIAVIEMGANHQKEIEQYCTYVEPTHGIITNCGKAHLEGFGGEVGVRKGKGELYDYLAQHDGTVFVNGDDGILIEMLKERKLEHIIRYGKNTFNKYQGKIIQEQPFLKIQFEDVIIQSNLFGSYNYTNIMCAVAVGKSFNVKNEQIKQAIENYFPNNARSQMIEKGDYKLILDAYNANPTSMQHALESLAQSATKNKIVILGDMFELGEYAAQEHQKIVDLASSLRFNTIVLVGEEFAKTNHSNEILVFADTTKAQQWFKQQQFQDAVILLKGSRSMKMEKVIE